LSLAALPVFAQAAGAPASATPSDQIQEVVITGIRASLEKSLDVKKESLGVVDAISSEDIGKFPDANLADALQRVPGVTINRGSTSAGGVPSSMGNGTEITVRGFGPAFNETLFDGRRVATAIASAGGNVSGDRGFDFSSVGADFVSQVDIMKTPDSALSAGAIGATIDIRFPKPFDHPGMQLAVVGSANMSDTSMHPTPVGGILLSDTFADDTFGVLVDAHFKDAQNETNHINVQGWQGGNGATNTGLNVGQLKNPGSKTCPVDTPNCITDWFIQDYGIYKENNEDQRIDARAVLQWRPSSNLLVTVNDDYSRDSFRQNQYAYTIWFNNGSLAGVTQAADGSVTSFTQSNTPTDFQSEVNRSVIVNNLAGVNIRWDLNDNNTYTLDAAQSESRLNPNGELSNFDVDVGYGPSTSGGTNGTNIGIAGVGSSSLPYTVNYGPNGVASQFLNNGLFGSHVVPMSSPRNSDIINQVKLEGEWHQDDQKMRLKYGIQYAHDHQNRNEVDDFANNDWQAYGGYGPLSNNNGTHGVPLPQQYFTASFPTGANFIPGFSNGGNLPPQILVFNPYQVLNYLQGLGNPQTKTIPGYNVGCCNPDFNGVYSMIQNPGNYAQIIEQDISPYINFSERATFAGRRLDVNVGVRDERTQLSMTGLGRQPTTLTVQSSDHTAYNVAYTDTVPVSASNRYNYLLPNVDLGFWVTDEFKVRFDASRTLTRPPLAYINPTTSIPGTQRVGALVATGGNPDLLPFTSDNIDLGAEWYYSRNSYVSVGAFIKDVTNFIVAGTKSQTINNVKLPDGSPAFFATTTNVNGPSAEIRGIELAWQHTFGDTGFGYQANATFVDTDKPYDPNNLTVGNFGITGLANSANVVGFYDKNGFQARVALNWRDTYLDHFGQAQNNSQFGTEPTFVNSATTIDFSSSYDFTRNFTVFFEAANLTDATYSTHGRYAEQLLDVIHYGRSYTLGLRAKL
jgi:TonB-dependent receptor